MTPDDIVLDDVQQAAVDAACSDRTLVVTGRPGTGKTTIIRCVLARWRADRQSAVLCAPTGKAAKRMQEQTGHPASTIHRLLGAWDSPLSSADALVVDEASMVDARLMAALLSRVPGGCRLLVVGDVDQLPSIGAGRVLADLIDSGRVPVARLERIYRHSERSWIARNASAIRDGEMPMVESSEADDFFFADVGSDPEVVAGAVIEAVMDFLPSRGFRSAEVCVLTPKSAEGDVLRADRFNLDLQARLNPPRAGGFGELRIRGGLVARVGDRVRHAVNDYRLNVFNGEVGVLSRVEPARMATTASPARRRATFVDYGDRVVSYDDDHLGELTLNYAGTIHSAQGSEYDAVVVVCHSTHGRMLNRNLLYTAVTRGKQIVVVVGDIRGLSLAVQNADARARVTTLRDRLAESGADARGSGSL